MSETIYDACRILLAMLVLFAGLGILRDAGLTGFSTAALPAPEYVGPETVFAQEKSQLTLDLNYYFFGKDLHYFIDAPASLDARLIKSILFITPENGGDYEITAYASNEQAITKQKITIKAAALEPKRSGCGCKGS